MVRYILYLLYKYKCKYICKAKFLNSLCGVGGNACLIKSDIISSAKDHLSSTISAASFAGASACILRTAGQTQVEVGVGEGGRMTGAGADPPNHSKIMQVRKDMGLGFEQGKKMIL